jgi:hypothetical protein
MEENITQEEPQLPPIDFISFISDFITTARLYLQGFQDPETEQVIVNLGLAKRMIDTLEMLEEKTKGNLTAPESNFLVNSLYDLRMGYVRAVDSQKDTVEQDVSDDTPEQDTPSDGNVSTEPEETINGDEKSNS